MVSRGVAKCARRLTSTPQAEEAAGAAGKKAKAEGGAASPKPAASPAEVAYVQQVHEYLKKNGATEISKLGTAVKRPAGVPKMKVVFGNHTDKFEVTGEKVSAK